MEIRRIKAGESFEMTLHSRGGLGLQLSYRMDHDGVVDVNREEPGAALPGDSLPVVYRIRGLRKGRVVIAFYETQPWNNNFREIVQKEVQVEVAD